MKGDPPTRVDIEKKLTRYLTCNPKGVSSRLMAAWIASCSRGGGYSLKEYEAALYRLRDSNRAAFANGVWYLRGPAPIMKDTP